MKHIYCSQCRLSRYDRDLYNNLILQCQMQPLELLPTNNRINNCPHFNTEKLQLKSQFYTKNA